MIRGIFLHFTRAHAPVPKSDRELPFYSEPVEGQLSVKAPKGLKLYKRAMPAGEMRQIAAPYIGWAIPDRPGQIIGYLLAVS